MNLKELLQKGYFPKELPPPFQTEQFSAEIDDIKCDWLSVSVTLTNPKKKKFRESRWVTHSLPKIGFSRRLLGIPNPLHQTELAETIIDKWTEITDIYDDSNFSTSKPVEDPDNKRAYVPEFSFTDFKRKRFIESFDKLYEVKTDISRFYATIYTHSIPWLVHTKPIAKLNRSNLTMLGNKLDKDLRVSNSGQTVGIPIGPDTSLIVAEIICCKLDAILASKFNWVKAFRYYDDYYIYTEDNAQAEKVFKFLQGLFTEYQLDANEEKTKISKSPQILEFDWSINLGSFIFRNNPKSQKIDLERYFSLSFQYQLENPKESVLKFAIARIKYIFFLKDSWELYQSYLLKAMMTEPSVIMDVAKILISNISNVDKSRLKSVLEYIIKEHTPKGHHSEVAWSLWLFKEFNLKLTNKNADLVLSSNDICSILIVLDLKDSGLVNSTVDTSHLEIDLTTDSLMDDKWLLTYESIKKGWLTSGVNTISDNEYFDILFQRDVEFYDNSRRIEPIKPIPKKIEQKENAKPIAKPKEKEEELTDEQKDALMYSQSSY
ncbi:RNA-directed DNA polymerase [Salegentibacter mishustinae]|uniref:Reverse transcriptase n=1 Tax=Salegentibacter mishustinae TaxID=270918 RepID=A0A0Q9ZIT6_9FLAO|nr:RNA-directed DNA polymerase [Salegentibacter mishustinae]KRG28721.1 reverse transcriptase [Salegentibacter mishustinae]PNW21154.1 reverse transcriptase [Salegentibacter mishustinae]PZX59474.1 reverse transcriptase (RNA-dependent DNA polymerase) [Salegentibacter mishustinae]GGX01421.1 reverse transcriptase [Salegentibacter mishustinae]